MKRLQHTDRLVTNPFASYSPEDKRLAKRYGIVRDVTIATGVRKSKISRIFCGTAVWSEPSIVRALNRWLTDRNLPPAPVVIPDLGKLRQVA